MKDGESLCAVRGKGGEWMVVQINCLKCRHYYVTWDAKFPKGCRAFGFKTNQVPSVAVLRSSGSPCLKFDPKDPPIKPTQNGYYV